MVSANVLYMIWEQILFKERKRIFLFMPAAARRRQGWVGRGRRWVPCTGEGVPRVQSCCGRSVAPGGQWCLPRNVQPEVPIRHPRTGEVMPPPCQIHRSAEPRCPRPYRFSSQTGARGWAARLVLQGKTQSHGLPVKGREHVPRDTGHSTAHHKCQMSRTPRGLMRFAAARATKELMQYFICFLCRSIYYLF